MGREVTMETRYYVRVSDQTFWRLLNRETIQGDVKVTLENIFDPNQQVWFYTDSRNAVFYKRITEMEALAWISR